MTKEGVRLQTPHPARKSGRFISRYNRFMGAPSISHKQQPIILRSTRHPRGSVPVELFSLLSTFIVAAVLALALAGCERRDLTYSLAPPTDAEVEIRVDWSLSGLPDTEADYGATVVFFPADDGEDGAKAKTVLLGDRNGGKARIPCGRYRVVVFNRSFDDFEGIGFRGTGCDDFEAYASRRRTQVTDGIPTEYILPPEPLASSYEHRFEVTQEMIDNDFNYRMRGSRAAGDMPRPVLRLTTRPLTEEVRVNVRIRGLGNIRNASCRIGGVSEAALIAAGTSSAVTGKCGVELAEKAFDPDSGVDGVMTAAFTTFGFDPDAPHELDFTALLVDGKTSFNRHFDNVDVNSETDAGGDITLTIDVFIDRVPDVKPEGGADSGFGSNVGEWGEDEESGIVI